MSTVPIPTKAQKSRKEKDKERKASLPQQNERLKTVVRRLPPNLPEDIFWQSVQAWVTDDTAIWKLYCPGKLRKKLNKENVPSRAYIAFKDEEKLALFSREYDGHVFRDKSGVESQAVVEFAPYPKIPSEKRKPDPRNATIEKDEDYISFLETLKAAENPEPVTLESLIAASQPAPPPKTTPLLEALKAEKSANKDKEAILRNHAHYNNMNVTSLRKEEKKKASGAPPPAKQETNPSNPPPATGKKAQKKAQAQATAAQNAKAPQQGASTPAPKGAANAPSNPSGKPAKPPRPPRGQVKAAAAAATAAAASEATRTPTILAPPSTEASAAAASTATPAPAPAAPTARRTRPVIGLANRQFEAALSSVSGLASAATERKKREKEREAQAAAGGNAISPPPTASATTTSFARIDGSDTDKPPSPASPKKEKTRRGGRGGGGAGASGGGAAASGSAPQVKVPSILQRAPDASAPAVTQQVAPVTPAATPSGATPANAATGANAPGGSGAGGGAGRGGGRRGRGGGRGRGGAPNAPRGGG